MGAVISFFVSAFLILGLITLRYIEIGRGGRFAQDLRLRLDARVEHGVHYVVHMLPTIVMRSIHIAAISVMHRLSLILLQIVRVLERQLYGFANVAKGRKKSVLRNEKPSPFLQSMAEHKQKASDSRQNRHEEE